MGIRHGDFSLSQLQGCCHWLSGNLVPQHIVANVPIGVSTIMICASLYTKEELILLVRRR